MFDWSVLWTKELNGGNCWTGILWGDMFAEIPNGRIVALPSKQPSWSKSESSVPTPKSQWLANMATWVPTDAWVKPLWRFSLPLLLNWNCWLSEGSGVWVNESHPWSSLPRCLGVWVCMLCTGERVCVCTDLEAFLAAVCFANLVDGSNFGRMNWCFLLVMHGLSFPVVCLPVSPDWVAEVEPTTTTTATGGWTLVFEQLAIIERKRQVYVRPKTTQTGLNANFWHIHVSRVYRGWPLLHIAYNVCIMDALLAFAKFGVTCMFPAQVRPKFLLLYNTFGLKALLRKQHCKVQQTRCVSPPL